MRKFTKPLESATRIKINNWLVNLGWVIEEDKPECNCYTERARTVEENKKFKGKGLIMFYIHLIRNLLLSLKLNVTILV